MYVLGISAYYHDSAACLLKDGQIVAAAQEEWFSRVKHDSSFPQQSIHFCWGRPKYWPASRVLSRPVKRPARRWWNGASK